MRGNVVVGQSGGPTAAINSTVAGIYTKAKRAGVTKVFGMENGIQGFLEEKLLDLDEYLGSDDAIELLMRTPSAFLGSCRYKLPAFSGNEEVYEKIFLIMEKNQISCLFYIGGNDSMDTIKMLSDYAKLYDKKQLFIGIPKTIDNDLPITDHCPGYGSAAKYIATSIKEIIRDNAVYGDYRTAILLVEIMGRHAGWLTAAAALAKDSSCEGVDAIYLPETNFDQDAFIQKVRELAQKKKSIVIAVSEGIHLEDGRFICEIDGTGKEKTDVFGHKQLSGCGVYLAGLILEKLNYTARVVEFSTLQRSASHLASQTDIEEAFMAGQAAVAAAEEGVTGSMVIFEREPSEQYKCSTALYDIHGIANMERVFPTEWISEDGCNITDEYVDYARPLIQGEVNPVFENGVPKHLIR
ncbi:MAG TPA: 6-phosphofructokinase [Lachnospiraceae bacterium]|nr:6-phosphofructokinase [Lachnospiraceae bacterium]